ncbi:MAG TPA: SMP-30/gluconolactonase/LRE family protein [Gemmatimonadaceae bacterium]|nr:SMP-30/gluconolactonase/LRE family protein [Gemmatimonadaceae bacterium]
MNKLMTLVAATACAAVGCNRSDQTARSDTTKTADSGSAGQSRTISNVGFSSPETAVWDSVADVYLLSNINGPPEAEDNNGFIARIKPDGTVEQLKWIQGGKNGVILHGPKGILFKGDTLFAADVGGVRMFDRKTGRPLGTMKVATTGLNDLAVGPDGTVYVTDLEPPPGDSTPSPPVAAIYRLTRAGGIPVVTGDSLQQPDGLLADASGFIVAPFGANELYRVDSTGKKTVLAVLPGAKLDGLLPRSGGGWLVTSWDTKTVYRVDPGGAAMPIVQGIESPAQLGIDGKRHLLLIPSFNNNALEIRAENP